MGILIFFYSLEFPEGAKVTSAEYALEERACQIMSKQIKQIMPAIPMFKKYFQALSLINFLTYHFTTLKHADKVPALTPHFSCKRAASCPSLFPPFPLSSSEMLEFTVLSLLNSMPLAQQEAIVQTIRNSRGSAGDKGHLFFTQGLEQFVSNRLSADHPCLQAVDWKEESLELLKQFREIYQFFAQKIDDCLVTLGIKGRREPTDEKSIRFLIAEFEESIEQCNTLIEQVKEEMALEEGPSEALLAELNELQDMKTDFIRDREMWLLWQQGSLVPSLGKIILRLDLETHEISLCPQTLNQAPDVAGGCAVSMVNKVAEFDPPAHAVLEKWRSTLSTLPYEEILPIEGPAKGILFKIAFEHFPITNEEERLMSLGYFSIPYGKRALNNAEVYTLDAIRTQDEVRFTKWAAEVQDWDFEDSFRVTPLHYAAGESNPFFLSYILARQQPMFEIPRDSQGYTPLHYAARDGRLQCLETLLLSRMDLIDCASLRGETAFHLAVYNNQVACIEQLLHLGGNPNLKTMMGMSPLMMAVYLRQEKAAVALLKHWKVDLEQALCDGTTVFHLAVASQSEQLVSLLSEVGCNGRRVRSDGYTPLHMAVQQGWVAGVKLLLAKCASLDLHGKEVSGRSPLELAVFQGDKEIAELLRKHL